MRVFTLKGFRRFARKERIDERRLCEAVARAENGLIDADLGGGIIKQRVARLGGGRSGGYRTVIAYRSGRRAIFLYAFAKNERDNIGAGQLGGLQRLASEFLGYNDAAITALIEGDEWREVMCDEDEEQVQEQDR